MKWLLAGCAAAALCSGAAMAGPCSQQITALERNLSARDAGAGPVETAGKAASAQVSEAGGGTRGTGEASRSAAEVRAKDHAAGDQAGNADRVGPTEAMGRATGGSAASAQDARLQQQGRPTQAEAARNATPDAARPEGKFQQAAADLDRARSLDGKNDSACMGALDDARKAMAAD